ncbi:hypothetical protein [Aneurinibacillus uraniidurans]|uniref:hypothetical protein n=1 Tax=Aneurinibacillus uraniidurans TaxID=2966586 RepID=UPI002349EDE7|nr:hypothetical protein [Aneurinibacillus sp. B1]WCN39327.1 hypothetical protein PO771_08015 [Aneurinibacillus sp. B1]
MNERELRRRARRLEGQIVAFDLKDGTGQVGKICRVTTDTIFVLRYLYHNQFATFRILISNVRAIRRFPRC